MTENPNICTSVYNALANVLKSNHFDAFEADDEAAWEQLFECTFERLERIAAISTPSDDREMYGYFWKKLEGGFVSRIELSVIAEDSRLTCNYGMTCDIIHIPTSKALAQIAGGNFDPITVLYQLGVLNFCFSSNSISFVSDDSGGDENEIRTAENRLAQATWNRYGASILKFYNEILKSELNPWLAKNSNSDNMCQLVFPVSENLPQAIPSIVFLFETGQTAKANSALQCRFKNDKAHCERLKLPPAWIELERQKQQLIDDIFVERVQKRYAL